MTYEGHLLSLFSCRDWNDYLHSRANESNNRLLAYLLVFFHAGTGMTTCTRVLMKAITAYLFACLFSFRDWKNLLHSRVNEGNDRLRRTTSRNEDESQSHHCASGYHVIDSLIDWLID